MLRIANMANDQYTRVPLDENSQHNDQIGYGDDESEHETKHSLKSCLGMFAVVAGIFAVGFVAGGAWAGISKSLRSDIKTNGLLSPQSFIPKSAYCSKGKIYGGRNNDSSAYERCGLQLSNRLREYWGAGKEALGRVDAQ